MITIFKKTKEILLNNSRDLSIVLKDLKTIKETLIIKSDYQPLLNKKGVVYQCSCIKDDFITDINKLCKNCEIKKAITSGVYNQVMYEAKFKQQVLSEKQFKQYFDSQIKMHSEKITRVLLRQRQSKDIDPLNKYLATRVMGLIWSSECIRALNKEFNL